MPLLDTPSARAAYDDAPMPRMSFGDHLDELRRRLVRALLAMFGAVVVVMPFKTEVTGIVIEPYRVQWRAGFHRWVAFLEQKEKDGRFAEQQKDANGQLIGEKPDLLGKGWLAFCREHREKILAGTFEYPQVLVDRTGFPVPYSLVSIHGLEDMFAYMFASLIFALLLASPVVIWQVWAFVAAGLYPKEKALFYRYFPFMIVLLVGGALFGYWIALPVSLGFLITLMDPSQVGAMLSVGQYFTLLFAMTAALGVVFQLPLVMVAMQRVGLVTHRAFLKNWRITVLSIFIVAAVFTPPEPVSMLLVSAPMLLLYCLGLLLTWIGKRHEVKLIGVAT